MLQDNTDYYHFPNVLHDTDVEMQPNLFVVAFMVTALSY